MTREEAIARIKDHMSVHKIEERAVKITEALNMAISALEQPEIVLCKDCEHSDTFPTDADADIPLKCLGIRYGGVYPDWFCEHAERRAECLKSQEEGE